MAGCSIFNNASGAVSPDGVPQMGIPAARNAEPAAQPAPFILTEFVNSQLLVKNLDKFHEFHILDRMMANQPKPTRYRKFIRKWKRRGYQAKMAYLVLIGRASVSEYY